MLWPRSRLPWTALGMSLWLAASTASAGPPEPAPGASRAELRPGVWVTVGVATAATFAATVLGVAALSEKQAYDQHPTEASADRGERYALFADISLAVAVGAAVTGLVLGLSDRRAAKASAAGKGRGLSASVRGVAWHW